MLFKLEDRTLGWKQPKNNEINSSFVEKEEEI